MRPLSRKPSAPEGGAGASLMALLVAITVFKLALASVWGWTADIPQMQYSAEAFLAGQDILDPINTHHNPAFFPIGHHLVIAGALLLSRASGIPFAFLIKIPAILADLLVALLLRSTSRGGDRAALLYLANPVTFLLAVYHGQLHTVATAGAVLTLWLVEREQLWPAGIMLGLAVSVRQHFAILAAPLLARLNMNRDRLSFAGPFVVTVFLVNAYLLTCGKPGRLFSPITTYGSWGYTMLLLQAPRVLALFGFQSAASGMTAVNEIVKILGARINLAWAVLFLCWIIAQARRKVLDPWRAALLYCVGMYSLAPGIGVQWLVWAVPFWLVVDRRQAMGFSTLAGAFMAGMYWQWTLNVKYHVWSLTANLHRVDRWDLTGVLLVGLLGLLTWLYVLRTTWHLATAAPSAKA